MALKREYFAIQRKKTWTLVKRSEVKGQRVLRGKLVFKKKRDKNGNILKYKVRWVVRGFEQQYGKDYDQPTLEYASLSPGRLSWPLQR
jgi:hypothetical protein